MDNQDKPSTKSNLLLLDKWVLKNVTEGDFGLSNNENTLSNNLVIYPNPTEQKLNIKLHNITLKASELSIFNTQNKLMEHINLEGRVFSSFSYDTSKLGSGIYFLKLQLEEGLIIKKFIVK